MPSFGSFCAVLAVLTLAALPVPSDRGQSSYANQDRSIETEPTNPHCPLMCARRVTVIDDETGEAIRSFEVDFFLRAFLLDNGRTVAVTRAIGGDPSEPPPTHREITIFWYVETGEEIARLPDRVYGFSEDESLFFTQTRRGIFLYQYPSRERICLLSAQPSGFPNAFQFSPDNRFLAITSSGVDPDAPIPPVLGINVITTALFNTEECREVLEILGA